MKGHDKEEQPQRMRTDYGRGISVDVCTNCARYWVHNDPQNVFHAIGSEQLKEHENGILTPKGSGAPYEDRIHGKSRFIHLGPLGVCGLGNGKYDVYFAFDVDKLEEQYPGAIQFVNYGEWVRQALHNWAPREDLFRSRYDPVNITEILVPVLDVGKADFLVAKTPEAAERAKKFMGRGDVETVFIREANDLTRKESEMEEKLDSCPCWDV